MVGETVSLRTAIRLGALMTIFIPLACAIGTYWIDGGSLGALPGFMITSALGGAFGFLEYAFSNPLMAALYAGVLWVVSRIAFGAIR